MRSSKKQNWPGLALETMAICKKNKYSGLQHYPNQQHKIQAVCYCCLLCIEQETVEGELQLQPNVQELLRRRMVETKIWRKIVYTLTHGCLKVHGGVPIDLGIFVDPLKPRVNCLVFREFLIALFLNPESQSSSHDSSLKCQPTKKHYNTRATHFTEIVYLKQRQEDMLSLVFKKLNLCPVMPASRGVNPCATSHTV